ncbi:hypothetical protein [Shewanella fidelis]|uniref:Defence against restriction A N-terminal domain-containing protein n=1 Tax=Shewanella fidelis TaxID=173509 RepID=A0AAW8NS49_9GAMM|nr:hypothetical protein [Shewanella fidelis]MDR8525155.1 hypothetical protein [Shewanella fidelis]MDW4811226.1 hypothetical protein [Shewanella fidelis]MDW4814995.1 hypothetical protein [Shewanella fidelis]MDW4819085.1 hypothetical protein [Shewanella fidelis]MDW4823237.1 hypothetical protein [Shewanella fidelis]
MSETVFFEGFKSFYDGAVTVNAEYANEKNSALLIVGKAGYDSIEHTIKRGHRAVFSFDYDFEVQLLKIGETQITVDVRRLEGIQSKYRDFIDNSLGSIPDSEEKFTKQEIDELKEKLTNLQKEFTEHQRISREEAAYAKASFELLIKKLDESSRTSWRQTAYSIATSIGLSITPEGIDRVIETSRNAIELIS